MSKSKQAAQEFINQAKIGSFVYPDGSAQDAEYLDELARKLAEWTDQARMAAAQARAQTRAEARAKELTA